MASNLNSLVRLLLIVMLILNIGKSSESRPHDTFLERVNVTKALRSLFENKKRFNVELGEDNESIVDSPNESKRRSPGGPDPHHHSKNLS